MRLILLFLFLSTLLNVNIVAATQVTPPVNIAPSLPNTQNNHDLVYQQLFSMHSQLASLDEKLQQQKTLGNDVKALEAAQQELKVQLASLQTKLDAQDKLHSDRTNLFNERAADMKDSFNWWFFTLTVLLAGGGYIVYRQSKKEAEDVASVQMKKFIMENSGQILEAAQTSLQEQLGEANVSVEYLKKYIDEAHQIIEEKKKEVEAAAEDVQKSIAEKKEPNPESLRILENSTKKISKEHTTAREYLNLASVSYGKKNYKEALKYLNLAINTLKDSEKQTQLHAQLLWNKANAYSMLQDVNAELKAYDELIQNFKSIHNEGSWKFVAKAMLNQGVAYRKQGRLEDALNSNTSLIENYKDSLNEEVQIQVAGAICNQSAIYGLNKDFPTALKLHSMLLETFHNSENGEIKKIIANSRANIAELALLYEAPEHVLTRVTEVEEFITDQQILAVMQFIRFLLNDKSIEEVFIALNAIPAEMELEWSFREIKDYLANFEGEKLHQIQAVVSFFEQHKDIEKLRIELGLKS